MPIYEFACQNCDTTFEALVMNTSEKVACPSCESSQLKKLISAHAVGTSNSGPSCDMPACGTGKSSPCGGCPTLQ